MSELVTAPLSAIDANPFRRLGAYPFVERKVEALMRSYADVGMWEGVIARKSGNRYQIAFGHHRIEAAKRSKLKSVSVILRDLSDEEMLQFMGRENMEDYNADFLTMLETWEAAVSYFPRRAAEKFEVVDIARLLGWVRDDKGGDRVNDTAEACNSAYELLAGGYIKRDALVGLSVKAARDICGQARSMITRLDRAAKTGGHSAKHAEGAKKKVGKAVERTAKDYLDPKIANVTNKNLRGRVEVNAYRFAKEAKRQSPLFEQFGKTLADGIAKMLECDATADKLSEVVKALDDITMADDERIVERLRFELGQLGDRAATWDKRLIRGKVHNLRVEGGE